MLFFDTAILVTLATIFPVNDPPATWPLVILALMGLSNSSRLMTEAQGAQGFCSTVNTEPIVILMRAAKVMFVCAISFTL